MKTQVQTRAPWTQCTLDCSQLESADNLARLSLDTFAENAEGVCLLMRPMFTQVAKVRSEGRLLVVLPGSSNSHLTELGIREAAYQATHMFVADPGLLPWYSWVPKQFILAPWSSVRNGIFPHF